MMNENLPELLLKLTKIMALSGVVVWVLTRRIFERVHQGVVLVVEAVAVGLIALYVLFGDAGVGFGIVCAGGALGLAGVLYVVLALMDRWAKGGGE